MHILNRILVVLGLLAVMVLSAVLFLAWGPFLQLAIGMLQQAYATLNALAESNPLLRWAGGFGLTVLIWAVCIALLWLETRRPRARTITVQQISGGHAELTVDSIISRLQYNLEQLPDIIHVWPRVRGARKGVRIDMAIETNPEVDVPAITEEIRQRTRDIMEQHMGLKLDSMRVVIRHAPYPKSFFKGERVEAPPRPAVGASRFSPAPSVATPPAEPAPVVTPPVPAETLTPAASSVTETPSASALPAAEPAPLVSPTPQANAAAEVSNNRDQPSRRPWSFLRPRAEEAIPAPPASESVVAEGGEATPAVEADIPSSTETPSAAEDTAR
ncbi:MAG: hypothetical protein DDG58_06560 [Ardenticatenia bacterium]|nr:MAG: hypothetical protein DDG58_06560 [Ardenticatenia bacterium]